MKRAILGAILLLSSVAPAQGLYVYLSVSGPGRDENGNPIFVNLFYTETVGYRDGAYHPLIGEGLQTTADLTYDFSEVIGSTYHSVVADAAAYGTEFSRDAPTLPMAPGVEPMAFARLTNDIWNGSAYSYIEAEHRVRVLPGASPNPQVDAILSAATQVRVVLKYELAYSQDRPGMAGAAMGVRGPGTDLERTLSSATLSGIRGDQGVIPFTVSPTQSQQNLLYTIWAEATVLNQDAPPGHFEAQAVADPLLEIDPDWIIPEIGSLGHDGHGAIYFVVEQESVSSPGTWEQMTRDYLPPDNCTEASNLGQGDLDQDGYGDACDCDFDQDFDCDLDDYAPFLNDLVNGADSGIGSDMEPDGWVGIRDFDLFLAGYRAGAPGPSNPGP